MFRVTVLTNLTLSLPGYSLPVLRHAMYAIYCYCHDLPLMEKRLPSYNYSRFITVHYDMLIRRKWHERRSTGWSGWRQP